MSPFDFDPSRPWPTGATRTIAMGEAGLLLGAGTILAPFAGSVAKGAGHLAVDPERVLALLAVAVGRPVAARVLIGIEAAASHWARGDRALANIRLVFAGLPRLAAPVDADRLAAAAWLLDQGMTPRRLMAELDLDTTPLDEVDASVTKYNPDQPRVPAGNGVGSGRWIGADGAFGLTGRLRVSQLRFDAVQVAANGPFTDGGQVTSFTTTGNPLDPKRLNKPTTAEERQALIDTLNTFVEGRGHGLGSCMRNIMQIVRTRKQGLLSPIVLGTIKNIPCGPRIGSIVRKGALS